MNKDDLFYLIDMMKESEDDPVTYFYEMRGYLRGSYDLAVKGGKIKPNKEYDELFKKTN